MNEIKSCTYNIDAGAVEIAFTDGQAIAISVSVIEDTLPLSLPMQTEYDRLIYDEPLTFAELVLSGELETYLKQFAKSYSEQEKHLREQLEKRYSPEMARGIALEFMMYDS